MLIHQHSERVGTPTVQASGAISTGTVQSHRTDQLDLTTLEVAVMAFGWLLLGIVVGWGVNRARVARLRRQRDRARRAWLRAIERHELAKQVIVRMVEQEATVVRVLPRSSAVA